MGFDDFSITTMISAGLMMFIILFYMFISYKFNRIEVNYIEMGMVLFVSHVISVYSAKFIYLNLISNIIICWESC